MLKRSTSKTARGRAKKKKKSVAIAPRSAGEINRDLLRSFTEFMREEGLASFTFKSKDFEVELKFASASAPDFLRNALAQQVHTHVPTPSAAGGSSGEIPGDRSARDAGPTGGAGGKAAQVIKSPFVGTFYRSAGPGKPPFVEIGTVVNSGDALCILEAMKLMNEIEAEFKCKIVKILADDGLPVEYGEALFEVETL